MEPIRIGIIGDYDPNLRTHKATNGALWHAGEKLSLPLEVRWLPTPAVERLDECDGLFAAAGTPYVSMAGGRVAFWFSRTRKQALFLTFGWGQPTRIVFSRKVVGIGGAPFCLAGCFLAG